jgi:hypothetical protein
MKKTVLLFLSLFVAACFTTASAQTMTKAEKKALKKEIKTYKKNPEKWVRLMNRHKDEVIALEEEVANLKEQLKELQALRDKNAELQVKLAVLNAKYNNLLNTMPSTTLPKGTVYQVQMGYYENLNLISFNNKLKTVKAEEVGGAKRYVIGYFEDLMDAVQFNNDIKTLGVDDAFVSQYIDGERNMDFDALKELGL